MEASISAVLTTLIKVPLRARRRWPGAGSAQVRIAELTTASRESGNK